MLIALNGITYFVEGNILLDEIDMAVNEKDRIALIGRNGSGKSTLLNMLAKKTDIHGGYFKVDEQARILLVEQTLPADDKTPLDFLKESDPQLVKLYGVLDNADPNKIGDIYGEIAQIEDERYGKQATLVLLGLGISLEQQEKPMRELSGGLRMRVRLAQALLQYPDVLLLDEPTNHLDLQSILWLTEYLKTYPKPFVIVSHDRTLLNGIGINKTYHLQEGKLTCYSGDFNTFQQEYTLRQEQAVKTNINTDKKVEQMQEFVDKFKAKPKWSAIAKTRETWISNLEQNRPKVILEAPPIPIEFSQCEELKNPIFTVEKGSVTYGTTPPVLKEVDFSLLANSRIGILGRNGQGKSTLVRMVMNHLVTVTGDIHATPKLRVGYFSQEQADVLNEKLSVFEQLKSVLENTSDQELYKQLHQFGFDHKKSATKVGDLSGGEKTRLALLLVAAKKPHLIILDEPTNHLDYETKQSLISAINHFNGAVVLVSHDWELLSKTMNDYWVVAKGKVMPYTKGLDHYKNAILHHLSELTTQPSKGMVKQMQGLTLLSNNSSEKESKPTNENSEKMEMKNDKPSSRRQKRN